MRIEIKRVKIESSSLTNPLEVLDYAEKNGMKSIKVKDLVNIEIDKDKVN
jgi:hypothetical protein